MQESSARVQRAVAKAVTVCGCIEIDAARQALPDPASEDISYADLKQYVQSHLGGSFATIAATSSKRSWARPTFTPPRCAETFNLHAADILAKEKQRLDTLGIYSLMTVVHRSCRQQNRKRHGYIRPALRI